MTSSNSTQNSERLVVGYTMFGADLNELMFPYKITENVCSSCGVKLDFGSTNSSFRTDTTIDFAETADGQFICSNKFKDFCETNQYEGLRFLALSDDAHWHFFADRQVQFDSVKRNTRFEKYCDVCKRYTDTVGATPSFLKVQSPIPDGIFRSDLIFGSANSKQFLLFVGNSTKTKLEGAGLTGIEFKAAFN